ncbi:hypothetical protein HBI24_085700 [Parastagonospora nodorum]|nr:hypothetical protein HBH72_194360 [Parastagonospora nodorum]KAH5416320.1 hypothetical protein HBI46_118950 [Parastagonospora nodorum]KAH5509003.1 hypothetical protein HBI52_135940 [Parastagonospora nodorum]KAH5585612.1 hypothetical protein HBI24_085700 [Parastagonospora nodorum]KAH5755983.1 hypothetical protein HBI16_216180 [Parastagonospora nodorum]
MATRAGVNKRRISQVMTNVNDIPSLSFMEDLFGEEFPEAFGTGEMKKRKTILDLPAELLAIICEELSRPDIKRLRLANTYMARNVDLRIDRVFISPNRANLQCLRKIMDHPRYRLDVLEVVWDDAQLDEYPDLESFRNAIEADEKDQRRETEKMLRELILFNCEDRGQYMAHEHDDYFDEDGKLTEMASEILLRYDNQSARHVIGRHAGAVSVDESYERYQELYEEEQEAMERGYDAAALRHVLESCPKLERIVLTSEVWRPWHLQPVYHTPFHRSLPPGFRKPSVWPWLGYRPHSTSSQTAHRNDTMSRKIQDPKASLPHEFRGYSTIISSLLTAPNPTISDFIIYTGHEAIGISHQLFAAPNLDLTNTMLMARSIPLKRLQLTLNSHGSHLERNNTAHYLRSPHLHAFLSALTHLEHLDLAPNCSTRRSDVPDVIDTVFGPGISIPAALLPRLKTFALRNALLSASSLLSLLTPQTSSQHITLDNIRFSDGAFPDFARSLWMHYDRHVDVSRPVYELVVCERWGRKTRLCEEFCAWLYAGEIGDESVFGEGVGWVMDDRDERVCVGKGEWVRRMGWLG